MKIPFHSILGPPLKRNKCFINHFCDHPLLAISKIYTCLLGILGVILSLFDIVMITKCGPTLPGYLLRHRPHSGEVISPEAERDLKLLGLFFSFHYYLLLILGSIARNPVFFLPFLVLYAFIIVMEFINFILRIFNEGFQLSKSTLFSSMLTVYNWLSVFCTFAHYLSCNDY